MSLIERLLGRGQVAALDPLDDRYYMPMAVGGPTWAGVYVSPDSALRTSAVWACVRVIAESLASIPLVIYRVRADGGSDKALQHPLYDLLHHQPNRTMTAFEFVEMMTTHVLLRGNAYAEMHPGPRGPVDQLIPLHPDAVTVEPLPGGGVRYRVKQEAGQPDRLLNDDTVFHIRGLTLDGMTGLSVIEYARQTIGLTQAAEGYGARFFGNDSRPGGVLTHPGKLSNEAADKIKKRWEQMHQGAANQHRVAVLEEGLSWTPVGIAPEDAQFLETRQFQVEDIARFFRVPLHMIQSTEKTTSWGTGIEQLSLAFVQFNLAAWARRWEQAIMRDMIVAPDRYFAKFNLNALARGDMAARKEFYAAGRQWGWFSINDVRALEEMNPIVGGDVYLQPLNMVDATRPPAMIEPADPETPEREETGEREEAAGIHYRALLEEAAGRVLRKERAALARAAKKAGLDGHCEAGVDAADGRAWSVEIEAFYGDHAGFVAQTLQMAPAAAAEWVEGRRARALADGRRFMGDDEMWEPLAVIGLADLAEGEHV